MSFGLETGELPNPEAPWAWRSSAVAAGVPWGSFCHNCILSLTHTSKGTCGEERPTVTQGCSGAQGQAPGRRGAVHQSLLEIVLSCKRPQYLYCIRPTYNPREKALRNTDVPE